MRPPSLWAAVPAFYLLIFSGLSILFALANPSAPLFQAVYFVAWLVCTSHVSAVVSAINGYVSMTFTIALLCAVVVGLGASIVFLKGWLRLSAVAVILIIWIFNGLAVLGQSA